MCNNHSPTCCKPRTRHSANSGTIACSGLALLLHPAGKAGGLVGFVLASGEVTPQDPKASVGVWSVWPLHPASGCKFPRCGSVGLGLLTRSPSKKVGTWVPLFSVVYSSRGRNPQKRNGSKGHYCKHLVDFAQLRLGQRPGPPSAGSPSRARHSGP